MVELCTNNNLLVLNGRTIGDEEGEITYTNTAGESVNDIYESSQ